MLASQLLACRGNSSTCDNEEPMQHLEESVGQRKVKQLDQVLGSEGQLQHGDAQLDVLSSSLYRNRPAPGSEEIQES